MTKLTKAEMLELSRRVDELSRLYPVRTDCHFWPMKREGEGRKSYIRSPYFITESGEIAVFVSGCPGYIAATHVEPLGV